MKLLKKISSFFKLYFYDSKFRSKVHLIPELILIFLGFYTSNYSIIFVGCVAIAIYNLILNFISRKVVANHFKNQISNHLNKVSIQKPDSDDDIINL